MIRVRSGLLILGAVSFFAATASAVIDEAAKANAFRCDGTEMICDPVPGISSDGHVYAADCKILQQSGKVVQQAGGDALYGKLAFEIPDLPSGTLTFEIKGLVDYSNYCIPYYVQLSNGAGGSKKQEWQCVLRSGMKSRMELQWYGCCEAPGYNGTSRISPDTADGFTTLTMRWDATSVGLYQGRGSDAKLLHGIPNKLGSYHPSRWGNGACKNRPTRGSLIPSRIELPEAKYNKLDYYIRNVKLTRN